MTSVPERQRFGLAVPHERDTRFVFEDTARPEANRLLVSARARGFDARPPERRFDVFGRSSITGAAGAASFECVRGESADVSPPAGAFRNRSPARGRRRQREGQADPLHGVFPSSVSWAETAFQTPFLRTKTSVNRTRTVKSGFLPVTVLTPVTIPTEP